MAVLVQAASNTATTGSSLTITLGQATGAGNCLVVCAGDHEVTSVPHISSIDLGGVADNFGTTAAIAQADSTIIDCEIWTDPGCAGGQTSVVVNFSAGFSAAMAYAMEFTQILPSSPVDKTSGGTGNGSTFSSGATSTLAQPSELVIGAVYCGGSVGITLFGPSSPWTNESALNTVGGDNGFMVGYQVVSSTAAQTYSGSMSSFTNYSAIIATLKIGTIPMLPVIKNQAVMRASTW